MTQLLFYENATPVSAQRHKTWGVEPSGYEFARKVNAVPITAVEIPHAARQHTIVFTQEEVPAPVAILGVSNNENLYVTEQGMWAVDYVPAFVRCYPFVFAANEDRTKFTLCIDESWKGCNENGRGQKLFEDNAEPTPYLTKMLDFLKEYQVQVKRTQTYCKHLAELNLFDSMQAEFTLPDGTKKVLRGFGVVNRDRLKALPPEKLAELAKTDELELTYLHLNSMSNLSLTLNKVAAQRSAEAGAKTATEE